MLYGAKFVYIICVRHNYYTSRVLTRCSFYTNAACRKPCHLRLAHFYVLFLTVFKHISVGGFLRHRADCSGTEHKSLTEKGFRIFMNCRLIFARKVKVNIRLFIALESQKCFKRNIMTVPVVRCSAFWAHLFRQVAAGHTGITSDKFNVFAVRADIMRRK